MDLQTFGLYSGLLADGIAIVGIPYTAWQLYHSRQRDQQMQQEIAVQLNCNQSNTTINLPHKIKRQNLTRAELLGYLGMAVKKGDRFNLSYLKTAEFINQLKHIQESSKPETLKIPCGKMDDGALEITQFTNPNLPTPNPKSQIPMNKQQFQNRTKKLAVRTIKMTEALPNTRSANVIANQIIHSSASVAANYRSACRPKSKADMINKLKIVEEETHETLFWLEMLVETSLIPSEKLQNLIQGTNEILAMTVTSIKTLRKKS